MVFQNFFGRDGESAIDFLDNLEMGFLVSGRDDEVTKVRALPLVLKGEAKTWYLGLDDGVTQNWENLKEAFLQRFEYQESPAELWEKLQMLRQVSSNDYETYETQFSRLWHKWSASLGEGERAPDCLKKDCFIKGLFPTLKDKVNAKFPNTLKNAVNIARQKHRKLKFQAQASLERAQTSTTSINIHKALWHQLAKRFHSKISCNKLQINWRTYLST